MSHCPARYTFLYIVRKFGSNTPEIYHDKFKPHKTNDAVLNQKIWRNLCGDDS